MGVAKFNRTERDDMFCNCEYNADVGNGFTKRINVRAIRYFFLFAGLWKPVVAGLEVQVSVYSGRALSSSESLSESSVTELQVLHRHPLILDLRH